MFTKTINQKKENDLLANHSLSIPENIKTTINERWFYLYEWIWVNDLKLSIERDFLKYMNILGLPLAIIVLIPSVIFIYAIWILFLPFFFLWLFLINFFLLVFLAILSIKRSFILSKNAYVLLTDSHISLNWKIWKLSDFNINSKEIKYISNLFEEEIFQPSYIDITKGSFYEDVKKKLFSWYKNIMRFWNSRSREIWNLMILVLALYSAYAISLWIIYFFWIIFIWLLWILLSIINKKILLISGHEVISINDKFEYIDENSNKLNIRKEEILELLNDAKNNDWKDSLLTKINSWIEDINKYASNSIDTSLVLKKQIKDSKYSEMFNFSIYNSWIKKQIYEPLKEINNLLEKNLDNLKNKKIEINNQIQETKEDSLKGWLISSEKRIEIRIEEFDKHLLNIKSYLEKLS